MRILKQAEQWPERVAMPWYHSSDNDLPDGTQLVPRGGPSRYEQFYDEDPVAAANAAKHVWLSPDLESNLQWQGKHIYEVEPEGDPAQHDFEQYTTPSARIVRKVPFEDIQRAVEGGDF